VLDAAGHSVGQSQPDTARAPASTIKVLTAAVAIATLGADARFRTQLVAQGGVRDGAIEGSLALVGGGDPLLTSADIDAAAAELERRGVREIRGDVVIDATAFTGPEHNARWTAADRAAPYGAGTSAVSIDGGTRVRLVNGASTVQTIADQRSYAGSVLQDRLRAHHITIDGSVHAGRSAGGTVLWSHDSPPLAALIRTMLIESDNHVAEQLLREIGLASGGTGSEDAGIARMRTYLAQHNIPTDGLQLYDGSGLAYDDRATPRTLATLMWRIAGTPEGNIIHDSLTPTGNRSGQSEADGFIRLKTGRADTARGIVGSVDRGPAGPLSFAFLDHVNRTAASSGPRQALEETELHRLAHAAP
jgi:D-alanyl-D-alanine carboxypeptidase/D-alanyl-D-alanine-endopeptidase (penicillin-binding protein 4)